MRVTRVLVLQGALIAVSVVSLSCAQRPHVEHPDAGSSGTTSAVAQCWTDADGDRDAGSAIAAPTRVNRSVFLSGETAQPQAIGQAALASIAENCAFGAPRKERNFGPTVLVGREGYALEHSTDLKIPLWVCEHAETAELEGDASRSEWFAPDPELNPGERAELADYRQSGYDRGHLAPAGDFKYSTPIMRESFFLSNMSPQIGLGFNRQVWAWLEDYTRQIALDYGEAWIITGGIFDPSTGFETIGSNNVAVPTHSFKIVVVSDETGTDAVGFVLENKKYKASETSRGFQEFVTRIDDIEDKTGLDFLRDLPSNVEGRLELAEPDLSTW